MASPRATDALRRHPLTPAVRGPLLGYVAVAAFNLGTALLKGVNTAELASRQWWSSPDALIPEMSARWLLLGEPFPLASSRWHVSDRGPLQAVLLLWAGEWSTEPVPAYVVGVLVNSTWVVGLWCLLRALDVAEDRIPWVVGLTALTGAIWINGVYPWPKLLAGALSLGCAAAVLRARPAVAGALAGMAFLAHGTALFAVVGLVPWIVTRLGRRAVGTAALAAAVCLPWMAFGRIADPPGDRLVKWHFAGTDIAEPDPRSAPRAIAGEYLRAGPRIVRYKVDNARLALGDPTVFDGSMQRGTPAWLDDPLGRLRTYQVTRVVWAPGILLVGLLGWRRVPVTLWRMLAAGLAAFVVLEWGGVEEAAAFTIVAPMMLVVGWVAACALAARRGLLPVQAGVFVGLWWLAPPVAV